MSTATATLLRRPHRWWRRAGWTLVALALAAAGAVGAILLREQRASSGPPASAAQQEQEDSGSKPAPGLVQTFDTFGSKDPFDPLVAQEDSGGLTQSSAGRPAYRVALVTTDDSGWRGRAQITIDGAFFTVAEEGVFARHFKLLSVSGDCVAMLFGDDQFSLCAGDELVK